MFEQDVKQIQAVIGHYFEGIFYGDLQKLASVFHPQCLLFGDINGQAYCKNLQEYLEGVKNRKCPNELGESFRMEILGIDILNSIASIKLHVPMLGYNYYDYISMNRINGQWQIVHKMFTNLTPPNWLLRFPMQAGWAVLGPTSNLLKPYRICLRK